VLIQISHVNCGGAAIMQINCHAVLANRQQPTFKVELVAFIAPHMNGIVVVSASALNVSLIERVGVFTRRVRSGDVDDNE
jgi:hypothetical protein